MSKINENFDWLNLPLFERRLLVKAFVMLKGTNSLLANAVQMNSEHHYQHLHIGAEQGMKDILLGKIDEILIDYIEEFKHFDRRSIEILSHKDNEETH